MSTKHTPGPWKEIAGYDNVKVTGVSSEGGYICFLPLVVELNEGDEGYPEDLLKRAANARLIAAAPEMYELLKKSGCSNCQGEGFTFYCNGHSPTDRHDCGHCKEKRDLLDKIDAETT